MTVVTPPCNPDSMKPCVCWRGVKSPNTGMGMRIDQAGDGRRALRVDHLVDALVVEAATERLDPAVLDQDRVGVRDGLVDVAGGDRADVSIRVRIGVALRAVPLAASA